MVSISAQQIKELREKTGAGIADVKHALEESGGDMAKAEHLIEKKFGGVAEKKASREIKAGLVEAYVHSNGRIGVLVEVGCETDFVARNPQFKEFAHDIAMHIAAMAPIYFSLDSIPPEIWQAEKSRFEEETLGMSKRENIVEKIVEGKLKDHFGAISLLSQQFIKDQDKTVGDVMNEAVGKFGENIKIAKFIRFEI